ncbi:plasmid partitioning protein RepB [Methylobacterium platani]|uniref:Plasmid partitioning protein RepB n=2 Tax=Methylobacterium platani TaxID=427683 RepID=A0A179S2N3_9HYPH|nr:plasmid partitioning protein RepB [Methylobacterium platani]KMO11697.1 chromosome partitioning protein ParB [Methylobacterium platani JCM 14648]OAS18482.1 plasmid partitioning protein RepB [Methylobacterium platani]
MRKNLLANILEAPVSEPSTDFTRRGAARSMTRSIEEMAENTRRMSDGEAIVGLDTALVDASFVQDRLGEDDEDYVRLRDAIAEHGQATPILVRPHPERDGRFMIVYGHRRVRVARELGREVRAIVKTIEDIAHIVAQGQENAARADLSFIEKALFARKLLGMGQTKATIKAALTVDDTLLSRMLSVAETVPGPVVDALGAAKGVGRDRWEELKKLVAIPAKAEIAIEAVRSAELLEKDGSERFAHLLAAIKAGRKPPGRRSPEPQTSTWTAPDRAVAATCRRSGKSFSLSLTAKEAGEFGAYISSQLEALYGAFQEAKTRNPSGD